MPRLDGAQLLDAIADKAGLRQYKPQLQQIVALAHARGFAVETTDSTSRSGTLWEASPVGDARGVIYLSVHAKAPKGLNCLWVLLRELGEAHGEPPPDDDDDELSEADERARETAAWDRAWELVERHMTELLPERASFDRQRTFSLAGH